MRQGTGQSLSGDSVAQRQHKISAISDILHCVCDILTTDHTSTGFSDSDCPFVLDLFHIRALANSRLSLTSCLGSFLGKTSSFSRISFTRLFVWMLPTLHDLSLNSSQRLASCLRKVAIGAGGVFGGVCLFWALHTAAPRALEGDGGIDLKSCIFTCFASMRLWEVFMEQALGGIATFSAIAIQRWKSFTSETMGSTQ